jgi:hypothetical protein
MAKNKDRSREEQSSAPAVAPPAPEAPPEEPKAPEPPVAEMPTAYAMAADAPAEMQSYLGSSVAPLPGEPAVAPPAPEEPKDEEPPAEDEQPREPWRRIALCLKGGLFAFGNGSNKVLGGDWIVDQQYVAAIQGDESFRLFPVESSEDIDNLLSAHKRAVEELRRMAAEIGYSAEPNGAMVPARR